MAARKGTGRPTGGYKLADGTKVPSVTTVIDRFGDKSALLAWANRVGLEGHTLADVRKRTATPGSLAHLLIERDLHGESLDTIPSAADLGMDEMDYDAALGRARTAFDAYKQWRVTVKLEVIATEVPIVSERYRYAGTIDLVARIDGKVTIADWKTSPKAYAEHVVQVAAYRGLWDEAWAMSPGDIPDCIEAGLVVCLGREEPIFTPHPLALDALDAGLDAFRTMRRLLDLDVVLKKAAA